MAAHHTINNIETTDLELITSSYEIPWNQLKDKTVLISGASGFLASYMIKTLLYLNKKRHLNISIVAICRNRERFQKTFDTYLSSSNLKFIEQDICMPLQINQQIDFIIHAASQASPKYYETDPVGTLSANTIATMQLLELARKFKIDGFLYFSSCEVYGEVATIPTKEVDFGYLDPTAVRSCYAESKRMGENMCVSWNHQYGVPAKIVRPFHTYGPGMKLDDGRVYADFVSNAVSGSDIEVKSDGLARRSFCYLADATAGFWMILLKGANGQAYNVGNPEGEISIRDLADLVAGLDAQKHINVKFKQRSNAEIYTASSVSITCPDITKIKALGWKPITSLEDGFRKTIESYKL
ncbi:MAG: NAD-dependent epimerase/dehydratase family protein [Methylophilus sp.]